MSEQQSIALSGEQIAKLCKNLLPGKDDLSLISGLQVLLPDVHVRLARLGSEWYRIGGVVDGDGQRVSKDLIEWVDRTYLECGQNFQVLIEYALEQRLIATRHVGRTLYFVIETGRQAEDFILLEIDKILEVSDRLLINEDCPPEDQEDIIDPLRPATIENYDIGPARYQYRRKTDIRLFMETLNRHHSEPHPVQRFMDDWNRSSAGKSVFCQDWIIRPYRHTGRYGEQIVNAEVVNLQTQSLPHLEDLVGKHGKTLNTLLTRFDRHAGYSFAWYFYMVKGKLVSPHNGEAVYRDVSGDFAYLPERDEAVLKDWIASPYNV